MVIGDVRGEDVLTRVHSSCFTGEVLGSQRCDCRAQLDQAMIAIARAGTGVIVYLRQEGRGIGLGNKIRAYALQAEGKDTVEANLALRRIVEADKGIVVYLRQEGRGIGLGNKIRAYALQDEGHDTVDANLQLGFDADLRGYDLAAGILAELGVLSVRLMTNNPDKIAGLERAGIRVTTQESHWVETTEHAADYLAVKKTKMGHIA